MSCLSHEADLVDLARGVSVGADAEAALRAHLQQCPACAARLAREQQLTAGLRAVAAGVSPAPGAAALERQLVETFAARHPARGGSPVHARASGHPGSAPAHRHWQPLAAAAVLVLAVAVAWGVARWRPGPPPASQEGSRAPAERAGPAGDTARVPVRVATPAASARQLAAPEPARPPDQPRGAVARRDEAGDRLGDFIVLSTAAGLPGFESGRVVRIEIPGTSLAAYGFETVPDATAAPVQADVLVGQDGEPRAIRFVAMNVTPRSRQ